MDCEGIAALPSPAEPPGQRTDGQYRPRHQSDREGQRPGSTRGGGDQGSAPRGVPAASAMEWVVASAASENLPSFFPRAGFCHPGKVGVKSVPRTEPTPLRPEGAFHEL